MAVPRAPRDARTGALTRAWAVLHVDGYCRPPRPADADRMWTSSEAGLRQMADSAKEAGVALVRQAADLDATRAIVARGGVVGVWGFHETAGHSIRGYARLVMDTVELLGEDHVAFGTDMSGRRNGTILNHDVDLGQAVQKPIASGAPAATLRKIAFDNYARVLRSALTGLRELTPPGTATPSGRRPRPFD